MWNILQPLDETIKTVTIDFGSPISFEVGYLANAHKFTLQFNGEDLTDYDIPSDLPNIVFKAADLKGGMEANYFGEIAPG